MIYSTLVEVEVGIELGNTTCKSPIKIFIDSKNSVKHGVNPLSCKYYTVGQVENQKSLISFKSHAGLYGAHKSKVIHHVLKFQNICFHIGNGPQRGLFQNFEICL